MQKITMRTTIKKGNLIKVYDKTVRKNVVGKVIDIKTVDTEKYGKKRIIYIQLQRGMELFCTKKDLIRSRAKIINIDELIEFANDFVYDR